MYVLLLVILALARLSLAVSSEYHCIVLNGIISSCPSNSRPLIWTDELIAFARYAKRINQTGWAELEIVSNPSQTDPIQAYYSGVLEGFLTAPLINSHRRNNRMGSLFDSSNVFCKGLAGFVTDNLNHTIARVLDNAHDDYWKEVGLVLYQIAGLDDGASGAAQKHYPKPHLSINPCGTFQMNMDTESGDIELIKAQSVNANRDSHCSAFIKYFPDKAEVLAAQNTWGSYHNMLRILKKYSFNFSTSKAKTVTMSSYPGQVFSHDDFYVTSQNMVVQETSIENFNKSSWGHITAKSIVLEFIRNTVANRMASSGAQWASIFSLHNSGTYNNQYMIIDYKKFNQTLEPGFLTILEQLPHLIHYEDKTEHLLDHKYWASYNIPYFNDIYERAAFGEMLEKRGNHYSNDLAPRAQMFAREQVKVVNVSTLFHLMRYNDFKNDPLAKCTLCTPPYSAEYAIASRADLNDPKGHYPFYDLKFRGTGATDAKMTSRTLVQNGEFIAVAGPTNQGQPAFDWNTFPDKSQLHFDQPTVWKFKPVITRWQKGDNFPYFDFDF